MASSALSYAPASTARILWLLGDILLIAGCLHLATRLVVPDSLSRRKRWAVAGLSFIAVYGHIVAQLHCGQSTSLWLFLTLCAFQGMIRGRPLASGCALAAAVLLKCVPICLVPYYFFTRRPVAGVTAFAVAMMIGLSIPATVRGWDRNLADARDWVGHLTMSESLEQHSRLQNQSVLAQMIRWSPRQTQDVFESARHYWILTSLLSGAILYAVIARTPHAHAAHLSGILIYVTVFNPFAWRYNFLALVVPYAFVIADVLASRRMVYSRALIVIAASAVSTLPLGDSVYVQGGRLWGALGLAVAVVLTAWRQHQQRLSPRGRSEPRQPKPLATEPR